MTWRPPVPLGYLESVQATGGFAAPLLAGGSFTLAVLALQSSAPGTPPVSRWPDAALALFVAAGLLQIGTVQATAWTRRYMTSPDELLGWFPDQQDDGTPERFLVNMQKSHLRQALRWADAARAFFHAGILALLCGLLVVCVPPGGPTPGRWVVIAVCGAGVAGELVWQVRAVFLDPALRRRVLLQALVLAGVLAAAIVPFLWDGARPWTALLLAVVVTPMALTRRVVPVLSPAAGIVALLVGAPLPVVVTVLLPALVLCLYALADLYRRQRALAAPPP